MERWRGQVPAILMLWSPGMEGGHALADIVLGRARPTGRLPFAIPTDPAHLPPFDAEAETIEYGPLHSVRPDRRTFRLAWCFDASTRASTPGEVAIAHKSALAWPPVARVTGWRIPERVSAGEAGQISGSAAGLPSTAHSAAPATRVWGLPRWWRQTPRSRSEKARVWGFGQSRPSDRGPCRHPKPRAPTLAPSDCLPSRRERTQGRCSRSSVSVPVHARSAASGW